MTGFRELPLAAFAEALASDAATPGGGSASALAGALAAALVAMVARMTEGLGELADEADAAREELLGLVDEDARAFDAVMAAFRLPTETAEEKAARSEAIQAGYRGATEPPMGVCARALRLLELARETAERGNPNAVSDAARAAPARSAALEGAALNVRINLGSIRDEAFRAERAESLEALEARGRELRGRALESVRAKLG